MYMYNSCCQWVQTFAAQIGIFQDQLYNIMTPDALSHSVSKPQENMAWTFIKYNSMSSTRKNVIYLHLTSMICKDTEQYMYFLFSQTHSIERWLFYLANLLRHNQAAIVIAPMFYWQG